MCANYGYLENLTWSELARLAGLLPSISALNLPPFERFFPSMMAPLVVNRGDGRIVERMHWGLIPTFWHKPIEEKRFSTFNFNTRAADWLEKPTFREAIRQRRCIIPATFFAEYQGEKGAKQAVHFGRPDRSPFALAGVWSDWQGSVKGEIVQMGTFSILTTAANAIVQPVHPKAMPVILDWEDISLWIEGPFEDAITLARPCPEDELIRLQPRLAALKAALPDERRVLVEQKASTDPLLESPFLEKTLIEGTF